MGRMNVVRVGMALLLMLTGCGVEVPEWTGLAQMPVEMVSPPEGRVLRAGATVEVQVDIDVPYQPGGISVSLMWFDAMPSGNPDNNRPDVLNPQQQVIRSQWDFPAPAAGDFTFRQTIELPADLPPGEYRLQVAVPPVAEGVAAYGYSQSIIIQP